MKFPLRYDSGTRNVLDADGLIVCRNGDSVHGPADQGEMIVAAINSQHELAALRPLYGVLNAVRIAVRFDNPSLAQNLQQLLPRIDEVLKAVEKLEVNYDSTRS